MESSQHIAARPSAHLILMVLGFRGGWFAWNIAANVMTQLNNIYNTALVVSDILKQEHLQMKPLVRKQRNQIRKEADVDSEHEQGNMFSEVNLVEAVSRNIWGWKHLWMFLTLQSNAAFLICAYTQPQPTQVITPRQPDSIAAENSCSRASTTPISVWASMAARGGFKELWQTTEEKEEAPPPS